VVAELDLAGSCDGNFCVADQPPRTPSFTLPRTPFLDADGAELHSRLHGLFSSGSLKGTDQTTRPNSLLEHSPISKVKKLRA
jgi:hypothetical protein